MESTNATVTISDGEPIPVASATLVVGPVDGLAGANGVWPLRVLGPARVQTGDGIQTLFVAEGHALELTPDGRWAIVRLEAT